MLGNNLITENVALRKPTNQTSDVDYAGWVWSADYAVDGCPDRDMPDQQRCCSTTVPTQEKPDNVWRVFLLQSYIIDLIIVYGRSGMVYFFYVI